MVYIPNGGSDVIRDMAMVSQMATENTRLQQNYMRIMQRNYELLRNAGLDHETSIATNGMLGMGVFDKGILSQRPTINNTGSGSGMSGQVGNTFGSSGMVLPKTLSNFATQEEQNKLTEERKKQSLLNKQKIGDVESRFFDNTYGGPDDAVVDLNEDEYITGTEPDKQSVTMQVPIKNEKSMVDLGLGDGMATVSSIDRIVSPSSVIDKISEDKKISSDNMMSDKTSIDLEKEKENIFKEDQDSQKQYDSEIAKLKNKQYVLTGDAQQQWTRLEDLGRSAIRKAINEKRYQDAQDIFNDVITTGQNLDQRWMSNRTRTLTAGRLGLIFPEKKGGGGTGKMEEYVSVDEYGQRLLTILVPKGKGPYDDDGKYIWQAYKAYMKQNPKSNLRYEDVARQITDKKSTPESSVNVSKQRLISDKESRDKTSVISQIRAWEGREVPPDEYRRLYAMAEKYGVGIGGYIKGGKIYATPSGSTRFAINKLPRWEDNQNVANKDRGNNETLFAPNKRSNSNPGIRVR